MFRERLGTTGLKQHSCFYTTNSTTPTRSHLAFRCYHPNSNHRFASCV